MHASSAISGPHPIRPSTIILFWLPLAATWFMMALEGPYIAAIVARMPATAHNLAAFGVATALAWLIESPIMMLLSAATALVRDRASYLALRRFAFILNGLVTAGMLILSIPAVFRFIGEGLIGLPTEISRLAHLATTILILWPAAIGYRRFYQGILVRHHLTRRVAYGTVVRLVTMTVTGGVLLVTASIPGAALGAVALVTGVIAEAIASRMMAGHLVSSLMKIDDATAPVLTFPEIARFYYPLALTSILSMALGPLVTFGLGRGRAPIESLAVWPVVQSMIFLFRSGGVAFQEVSIALAAGHRENEQQVRRTAVWLGVFASLVLAVVAFTPLEVVWLQRISGLSPHLASYAIWPVRLLVLLPVLEYILSVQRARWILARRTAPITIATAIEAGGLAVTLFFALGVFDTVGAIAGALAMLLGRAAANGYLYLRASALQFRPPQS
ncbi:MAG: hypothetical protein WA208_00740 [Thermoanaerobaculia bacterium]